MSIGVIVAVTSLLLMVIFIWLGFHVAIVLAGVSFVGLWIIFNGPAQGVSILAQAAYDAIASHIFGVIPLFVFTGFVVAYSDIGKDAYDVSNQLLRRVTGGLGHATVAANAIFAAITGLSIASAAVFTRIAVPQMLRFGYSPRFAVGVVAGSSVLGMLIPPSLLMILYGFLTDTSVGDLFTAGIVPGLMLAGMYGIAISLMAKLYPEFVFAKGRPRPVQLDELMSIGQLGIRLIPIVLLIISILGGLYAGFFTATEAGATGALMALCIAIVRRKLTWKMLWDILIETGEITVAISFLIICASIYTRMLAVSGLPDALLGLFGGDGVGTVRFLFVYLAILIMLGAILDSASIMLIMIPLVAPIVQVLDLNPVWLGVVTVFAIEIGLLTPPFGLSVFVIKSSLAQDTPIDLNEIFKGAAPFALVMFLTLILITVVPTLSIWFLQ